ncbi:MAG: HD domain-containing protein [Clostridiales bacterium]|nr:HD domain-containing protein [Clostridiales bacterium]
MTKSFQIRLIKILLLGTIIPTVCFIMLFIFKHISIDFEAEKTLYEENKTYFYDNTTQQVANAFELVDTSMTFLGDKTLLENQSQQYYFFDQINKESNVLSYDYRDYMTVLSTDSNKFLNIMKQSKTFNDYLMVSDGNHLYFGIIRDDASLIFEYDLMNWQSLIDESLDDKYSYSILSNDANFLFSNDYTESVVKNMGTIYQGREFITTDSLLAPFDFVSITVKRDISREISSLWQLIFILMMMLVVYLLLTVFIVKKTSEILLKPLNQLVTTVGLIAHDHIEIHEMEIVEDEYKEIYVSFDEMIKNVSNNIDAIEQQSKNIDDKNTTMYEMNIQLQESLEYLKTSTAELELLEKQSKTLVDNIKDLMWVIDTKGRITYINNMVYDKLGYNVQDLIGVKLVNILQQNYGNEEVFQEIFFKDLESVDLTFITNDHESEEIFSCSTNRIFVNGKLIKIQGVCREITEERYIEKQMEQKKNISNTLNEISEILTRPEKLDYLLKHIVIRIEKLLNPLVCTIRMVDDKGRLELKAGIGEFYGLVQEKFLDIDKDISGKAIKEGKIIIISDKNEQDYHNYQEVYTVVEQSAELIFLPLEYDGTTIGVMSMGLRKHLTESDLKILKVFTNQASAAIEKARMYEEIESNYFNIIKALASTVEAKDTYTENHSIRVSQYSRMIAEEMGLSEEEVNYIDIAGLLHDIGKIGISDLILTKEGKLTEDEFKQIKKHPLNGGRIVSEMKLHPYIVDGVLLHHKRFDLLGYPDIDIDSLPLSARIIGVADAFDAMTSNRSYQQARTFDQAFLELEACSGKQFCPEVVNIMEHVIMKLRQMAS